MNQQNPYYIAIDIAKDSLAITSDQRELTVPNSAAGFAKLLSTFRAHRNEAIFVFEASGGYERKLMEYLEKEQLGWVQVNPARIRHFARSEGIKAKNDAIDARLILRFALHKKPQPRPAIDPQRRQLADLLDRRGHLSDALVREKNRHSRDIDSLRESIARSIAFLKAEICQLDAAIESLLDNDQALQAQAEQFCTVCGVGKKTSWAILAYLPEIGSLSRAQVVALAGLAPYDRDSGRYRGKRFIHGGRPKVRRALYMAALVAARHNPHIAAYVTKLKARGVAPKSAIIAAMRKLLVHLHSISKNTQFPLAA